MINLHPPTPSRERPPAPTRSDHRVFAARLALGPPAGHTSHAEAQARAAELATSDMGVPVVRPATDDHPDYGDMDFARGPHMRELVS